MSENYDPRAEGEIDYTRWLAEMQTSMAQSVGGTLLRGARPVPVDDTRTRPTFSAGALVGFSFIPTEPSYPSMVRLRDRNGDLIAVADLSNNAAAPGSTAATAWFGPGGINIPDGGFTLDSDAGFEGVVYLRGTD